MLAILQARMSSRRLPGKVMRPLAGAPMIGRQIERLQRAKRLDGVVLATSTDASDDPLVDYGQGLGVQVYRGDLDPEVKAKIRTFFVTYGKGTGPEAVHQREILAKLKYSEFRAAENSYLDPIRQMKTAAAAVAH